MIWIWTLVLGCGTDVIDGDGTSSSAFIRAIDGTDLELEERVALCEEVENPDMSADCVSMVVKALPGGPEEICPRIPEGRWQDECWFEAAEMRLDQGSMDELLAHCARAGRFSEACGSHVGSSLVERVIEAGTDGSTSRMRSLVSEWTSRSGRDRDGENLWRLYWQGRMERDPSVGVSDCRMVNHEPRICEQALQAVFRDRYEAALHKNRAWCSNRSQGTSTEILVQMAGGEPGALETELRTLMDRIWERSCGGR